MTDWPSTATARALHARASLYHRIREFFGLRGVLEVDTPVLGAHAVTDPHIESIGVPDTGWLQTSPEYHMKRLLAGGSGPIYQISHAFRADEQGRRHNREFTLLEWYRPGYSLDDLMTECRDLLMPILSAGHCRQVALRELFQEVTGLDPLTCDTGDLHQRARQQADLPELDRQGLIDWFMATEVEPAIPTDQFTLVHDWPTDAAALARIRPDRDGTPVAQRFEIFYGGLELANGYEELTDADEQEQRFHRDNHRRRQRGQPEMTADPRLLAALRHGLPSCSGVAVGLDRVLMCQLHTDRIGDVLSFPADRA